jgi:hypothetical protein
MRLKEIKCRNEKCKSAPYRGLLCNLPQTPLRLETSTSAHWKLPDFCNHPTVSVSMSRRPVLITGCSDGGLGAALALAFHKARYRVLASARNPSKMASLKAAGIETLALDVLWEESVQACVAEVTNLTTGALYALVNNAGGKNASVKSRVVRGSFKSCPGRSTLVSLVYGDPKLCC